MTWPALRTWDTPTPLIELGPGLDLPRGVRLFAKLETVNAGGSIKDRPVSFMLARAMAEGHLSDGRRLLDSSSGNAGIAYAMLGAAAGVGVTLVIPGNASRERLDRIAAHGAEVVTTDPVEGYDFAIETARRMAEAETERYWYADQYSNEQNWQAHYQTTGAEIEEQVRARAGETPDAFIAGVGTGGTITGVGRRLRRARPDTHLAVVVPEPFPGIEGLKPLGSPGDLVPEILDPSLIDERIPVRSEDAAATARLLARQGLFVGPSSGAFVFAAVQLARRGGFRTLTTLLCDTGERYASTGMWARDARPEAERSTSRGTTP